MVFLMMSKEEGYLCTGKAFIYQWLGRMSTSGSECWVTDTGKNRKRWGYSHAIKTFLLRNLHDCNCSLCCSERRSGHARRISSSNERKIIPHWSISCLSTHPFRSPLIQRISVISRRKGHALMAKSLDSYIKNTGL